MLVLVNFYRFLIRSEIVQAMARQVVASEQNRTFLVVLAPLVQIPVELEKLFVVVEHELPSREQLAEIARRIAIESGEFPVGQEEDLVLAAAVGSLLGSLVGQSGDEHRKGSRWQAAKVERLDVLARLAMARWPEILDDSKKWLGHCGRSRFCPSHNWPRQ